VHEKITGNEPFMCLEVSRLEDFEDLSRKFDILFPNRIIRLVHDGNYTPYFYLGEDRWEFKPPLSSTVDLSFRILTDNNIFDLFSVDEINDLSLLVGFDGSLLCCKVITHAILNNKEYEGAFLSNGTLHFLSQRIFPGVESFIEDFIHFLDAKIALNLLNECGIVALETKQNILGKND
jgi:hypothetical protein